MATVVRRNSHIEAEAEEEALRRQISGNAEMNDYTPLKTSPKMEPVVQAPHDPVNCDFDLVNMAESEEHSLALERRQISAMETAAMGGKRRIHTETTEPAKYAVETPENSHLLAGSAEAEEMAWALDRQISGQANHDAPRQVSGPRDRKAETEPEDPKEALERRCSHDVVALAEAEEIAYAYDRQVSGANAGVKIMGA